MVEVGCLRLLILVLTQMQVVFWLLRLTALLSDFCIEEDTVCVSCTCPACRQGIHQPQLCLHILQRRENKR